MSRSDPSPAPLSPDPHAAVLRAGRGRSWLPLLAAALLNLGLILAAWLALPALPEQVPTHWGADGRPDGWAATSLGTVALGPIILLGTCALMALAAGAVRMMAGPRQASAWQRFGQEGIARGATALLGWTLLPTTVLAGVGTASVLTRGDGATAWWVMPLLLTVALAVALLGSGPIMRREQRRMAERAAAVGVRPTPEEASEDARWTPSGLMDDPEVADVFVSKREGYGTGATVNVGTRAGRLLVNGFVLVFAVGLPLVSWVSAYPAR